MVILHISLLGFNGGTLVLIGSVPGHCLSFLVVVQGSLNTSRYIDKVIRPHSP